MRLIDADALYDTFERTPWMDNADRDIAEELVDNAPTVSPWVKTSDRLPTEKDESGFNVVVAYNPELGGNEDFGYAACIRAWCVISNPEQWPYWMPIPPMPEVEE